MDSTRFDEVAKRLATSRSRRTVLRGLGRGMAAGAIGAFAITRLQPASAAPAARPEGHPCEGNQMCADGLYCLISGPGQSRRCAVCDGDALYLDGDCLVCPDGFHWWVGADEPTCTNAGESSSSVSILPPVRKYGG